MQFRRHIYLQTQLTTKMTQFKVTLLFLLVPFLCLAQGQNSAKNKLFDDTKPIELILQMDMQKVLSDKSKEPEYSPAFLIHKIDSKTIQTFNIKIRARGKTRRISNICEFPPLKINFIKKSTKNTIFDGQDKIKMVTHCNESEDYQNFALLEYLVYKTYNNLTDYSYRVRMVNVIYKDVNQNYPDLIKSGFLIEDDELMAKRVSSNISDKKIWSPDSCDQAATDIFSLFQFMIGNTDWWIHTRHNVELISTEDNKLIPIPFDFDGAGIINTPYAMPSPQLPIVRVRDRFFKSTCRTMDYSDYRQTIELFNQRKNAVFSMLEEATFLDKKYRRSSERYLNDFYEIINDPEKFSKYISQNCEFVNTIPDRAVEPNTRRH